MEFQLEPYNRNVPPEAVSEDIRRVAAELGLATLTTRDYRRRGRFSPDLARRRFGSWEAALASAGLANTRVYDVGAARCVADLKRVAAQLGKTAVTADEYVERGEYSLSPFIRHFGTWFGALEAAGLERTRTLHVTDEDYFENLEAMWVSLGRQPHYSEVQKTALSIFGVVV